MTKLTKILSLIAVSSIAFVQSLFGEEAPTPPNTEWTVTGTTTLTITEVVPEGETPWKFTLTTAGVLTGVTPAGTGTKLNFRTIPQAEGYPEGREFKIAYLASSKSSKSIFSGSSIVELYWPSTVTEIKPYTFYFTSTGASKLEICDYPLGTEITTIGDWAFGRCSKLKRLRISDKLRSISSTSPFSNCSKLVFEGPMLPAAMKSLNNSVFQLGDGATPLPDGLLVIGGSDETFTWNYNNDAVGNRIFSRFNITNLVFGAGVVHAATNVVMDGTKTVFGNPYHASTTTGSSITNIVVKNPGVFAFGYVFDPESLVGYKSYNVDAKPTTVRNYDVAGWVTGTLVKRTAALAVTVPEARQETAKSYQTRIMAAKNIYWKEFKKARAADNSKYYTPWSELSSDVQQAYWDNFNDGNVGSGDTVPLGLTKGITSYSLTLEGEEPLDPLKVPDNVWIVFKEGPWPDSGFKVIVR